MMWVPLDGFKMQTAGAMYVTHAVARLQRSPFLGRSAVVERVEELEEVLCRSMGLLYLLYLLGPRLELWKNGIVLLSAHTRGDRLLQVEASDSWHGSAREGRDQQGRRL
jgi:hypothetical protein